MFGRFAMLRNAEADTLIAAARAAQAEGDRLWAAGDWRNAAAQGWAAVRDATAALLLEVNGKPPTPIGLYDPKVNGISVAISKLARERGGKWQRLDLRFTEAMIYLHDQAYDAGVYDDEIGDLVREAADYIRHAEELAGLPTGIAAD